MLQARISCQVPASGNYLGKELATSVQEIQIMRLWGEITVLTRYKKLSLPFFPPTGFLFQHALDHALWSRKMSVLGYRSRKWSNGSGTALWRQAGELVISRPYRSPPEPELLAAAI